MQFLKSLKINALFTAILYVVLGLLFILWPDVVTRSITVILGIVLTIAGVVYIIDYFRKWDIEYTSNGLAIGILLLFGALFLFLQSNLIIAAIPVLLGFAVVISGTIKLQNAIVLYRGNRSMWKFSAVLAAICLLLGILFMINPFAETYVLITIIGIGLLFSGVTDLFMIIYMSRKVAKSEKS